MGVSYVSALKKNLLLEVFNQLLENGVVVEESIYVDINYIEISIHGHDVVPQNDS